MISIGAVIGGPDCAFFDIRLRDLMRYCRENRELGTPTAEVNIVYHLPGSIIKPDYVGLRTARFSKADKILMIQIGVEEEWIRSSDEKKVLQYLFETADEALGLAKGKFEKHALEYDLNADRLFLDSWKQGTCACE